VELFVSPANVGDYVVKTAWFKTDPYPVVDDNVIWAEPETVPDGN